MKLLHPLPPSLGPFHPAVLIATWFWSGRIGFASGSWGSLAALPFAAAIAWLAGSLALIPAAVLLFALGVWASGHYADANDISDPSPVVVDEVVGQWLTLAVIPLDPILYAVGFFFFRLFDVLKPFPANWADKNLKGGIGIMTDDVFAAVYAALVTWGVSKWVI